MRQARLKPDYQDTWHHCYNRTVGTRADRPFGDAEKEMFVRMLKRLAAFYSVRVVSYTFMSNPLSATSPFRAHSFSLASTNGLAYALPQSCVCKTLFLLLCCRT